MTHIHSFDPISSPTAHTLILGSIPGKASLLAGQYYAHPQNVFWRVLTTLFSRPQELSYEARAELLTTYGIALWDVLKSCTRESSLDSDIDEESIVTNDFERFFRAHSQISRVFFNGAKAEHAFRKYVLPSLSSGHELRLYRLPSTSPANASYSFSEKLDAWSAILSGN